MTLVLLDTHVLYWWSTESKQLSQEAVRTLTSADELAVSSMTWYELAWLATHERITVATPVLTWLNTLARRVRTLGVTPAIAHTATSLPSTFPSDPADRLIYATAIEHGLSLVTNDRRLRRHQHPRPITVW